MLIGPYSGAQTAHVEHNFLLGVLTINARQFHALSRVEAKRFGCLLRQH